MGIKASVTCVMNFEGAQGYLVGQPHKGLQAMFTMMNTARLSVGLQGIGLSERAYQNALRYTRERLQSRALSGAKFPGKPADPIIVHPDVRRMLLTIKSLTEGSRLLSLHAASLVDVAHRGESDQERADAETLVSFLTPISKACQTEWSVENTYHALQCFGGHGYIREYGMEQLARDARITTIYEGTTGIQALDLIGRKTATSQAAGLKLFLTDVDTFANAQDGNAALAEFIAAARQVQRMGDADPRCARSRHAQPGRTGCRQLRLSVLFGLRGAGVLVGTQRGRSRCVGAWRRVQARQAGDRALLFRPHPAAHTDPRRHHPQRRSAVDDAESGAVRRKLSDVASRGLPLS